MLGATNDQEFAAGSKAAEMLAQFRSGFGQLYAETSSSRGKEQIAVITVSVFALKAIPASLTEDPVVVEISQLS